MNGLAAARILCLAGWLLPIAAANSQPGLSYSSFADNRSAWNQSATVEVDLTAALHRLAARPESSDARKEAAGQPERYHWGGLLWQSLAVIGIEHTFRLIDNPDDRRFLADNPFWHNYIASLKQWNMRRWSDGDNFEIAYIGHPLQGAVTGYIEIQNDPRGRALRIGDPGYWRSRFLAMMWANAFSVDEKVGPLGEAAIGSDGGYTYTLNCPYPCKNYVPGVTKYTNGTGWVKFVTTPTIGTLWIVAEDSLDRYVSDPVAEQHPRLGNFLRAVLNPARTGANALRGRAFWYRDSLHREDGAGGRGIHFERQSSEELRHLPRFELFPHLTEFSLPVNTRPDCDPCRRTAAAPAVGFAWRLARFVDFDSDFSHFSSVSPVSSEYRGGSAAYAVFGVRTGLQTLHYAMKAALRPGLVSFDRVDLPNENRTAITQTTGRVTHFAASLAISGDYDLGRHFALRASIGNTPIRYGRPTYINNGVGKPPYLNWLSKQLFATNENWVYEAGPVLRF